MYKTDRKAIKQNSEEKNNCPLSSSLLVWSTPKGTIQKFDEHMQK